MKYASWLNFTQECVQGMLQALLSINDSFHVERLSVRISFHCATVFGRYMLLLGDLRFLAKWSPVIGWLFCGDKFQRMREAWFDVSRHLNLCSA